MDFRTQLQLDEACGALNCWFCSQAYGRPIEDPETLMRHYIRSGGAADFAKRYAHAMQPRSIAGIVRSSIAATFRIRKFFGNIT